MEVPYEKEEGDIETTTLTRKRRSHQSHLYKKPISPTTSDASSCISNEFSSDSNLDSFVKLNGNRNGNGNGNGNGDGDNGVVVEVVEEEEPAVVKVESFVQTDEISSNFEEEEEKEEILVTETRGTNYGFSVHQNGNNGVYSLRESNVGDEEMDVGSNVSSFSKSPDTAVGLKYLESLLDDSSRGAGPTDTFNAENGIASQKKNVDVLQAEELESEGEEYDVERVIQKQETHDLYCPNCRSCITKRVILRRRKRKIQEISTAEEAFGLALDQIGLPAASDDIAEESRQPPDTSGALDSRLDAISCFSCFNIFIPSGEGFLCWRFKPKADATRQPDGTSIDMGQDEGSTTDRTGTIFPLWIVTCCQPAERKKSDEAIATLGSTYRPSSEDDTEGLSRQIEPPLPPSDDIPVSSAPGIFVPEHNAGLPHIERPQHGPGAILQNKPLNPIKPYGGTPSYEAPSDTTTDQGSNFPLWIMSCCQPSIVGTKIDPQEKLDGSALSSEPPPATFGNTEPDHAVKPDGTTAPREILSAPSGGTVSDGTVSDNLAKPDQTLSQREPPSESSGNTRPPFTSYDDNPISPFKPESPAIFVPGTSSPSKPIILIKPNDVIPLPPQTESPAAPGSAVLAMPPQPPIVPSDTQGPDSLVDVEPGLARESPRHGVSGLDIVKAIVYGGLLESITSLSVITSAAGGDATTLNIVALGLANAFGGLVVLVHNLRVLRHEHTTERYESQLGWPGHYMLHAAVAIISYLVFGLMSPLIYGFSFRKSDNKDYKLATLAAAALAGITLLSVAKAYVRSPPKGYIKTVFYYISLGFMVSGLGYVAGDVINMLLKKLGIFDPKAPENVPVLAAAAAAAGGVMNGGWSSY